MIRTQPTGAGHGLVEGGMYPTVGRNFVEQAGTVGAAQLLDLPVTTKRDEKLGPLGLEFLKSCCVG